MPPLGCPSNTSCSRLQYVAQLSADDQARIRAMIDIGPIGSPNFGRFVIDGDQSTLNLLFPADPAVDAASGAIEALFTDYFAAMGLAVAPSAVTQNAARFRLAGVPFGGLNTGYGVPKTAEEAALFGGTAGLPFDACTFLLCDSYANVSTTALDRDVGRRRARRPAAVTAQLRAEATRRKRRQLGSHCVSFRAERGILLSHWRSCRATGYAG